MHDLARAAAAIAMSVQRTGLLRYHLRLSREPVFEDLLARIDAAEARRKRAVSTNAPEEPSRIGALPQEEGSELAKKAVTGLRKVERPEEAVRVANSDVAHHLDQSAVPLSHRLFRRREELASDTAPAETLRDEEERNPTGRTVLQRRHQMPGDEPNNVGLLGDDDGCPGPDGCCKEGGEIVPS